MAHQIQEGKFPDGRRIILYYFFETIPLQGSLNDVTTFTADKLLYFRDWVWIHGRISSMIERYQGQDVSVRSTIIEELEDWRCSFSWEDVNSGNGPGLKKFLKIRSSETVNHYISVRISQSKTSRIRKEMQMLNNDAKQDLYRIGSEEPVESLAESNNGNAAKSTVGSKAKPDEEDLKVKDEELNVDDEVIPASTENSNSSESEPELQESQAAVTTVKHEHAVNSKQPRSQEAIHSPPPDQIIHAIELSSTESNGKFVLPDIPSQTHNPKQQKCHLTRSRSAVPIVAKSSLFAKSDKENSSVRNTIARDKHERKAKSYPNYCEISPPHVKDSSWLNKPSKDKESQKDSLLKNAKLISKQPSVSSMVTTNTDDPKNTDYAKVTAALKDFNRQLQRDPLPDIEFLDLKEVTSDDVKSHFIKTYEEVLLPHFKKYCMEGCSLTRIRGLPIYVMNYLLTSQQQLEMITILQDKFSTQNHNFDDLFWEVLMPEWTVALFMSTFKMNRTEALDRLRLQVQISESKLCLDDTNEIFALSE